MYSGTQYVKGKTDGFTDEGIPVKKPELTESGKSLVLP
jgi:hypothetical protein